MKRFGLVGGVGLLLLILGFLIAIKLRLLSKFGMYLGGIGLCFLASGAVLLFNTGLLIIGNLFILSGLTTFLIVIHYYFFLYRIGIHSWIRKDKNILESLPEKSLLWASSGQSRVYNILIRGAGWDPGQVAPDPQAVQVGPPHQQGGGC